MGRFWNETDSKRGWLGELFRSFNPSRDFDTELFLLYGWRGTTGNQLKKMVIGRDDLDDWATKRMSRLVSLYGETPNALKESTFSEDCGSIAVVREEHNDLFERLSQFAAIYYDDDINFGAGGLYVVDLQQENMLTCNQRKYRLIGVLEWLKSVPSNIDINVEWDKKKGDLWG